MSILSLIEGLKPLTDDQKTSLAKYEKEMEEIGIPEILADCVKRVNLSEEARQRVMAEKIRKASYIGTPAVFKLEQCCQQLWDAFCCNEAEGYCGGIYLVGSAIERPDWRDIDIRIILNDDNFKRMFPRVQNITTPHWESDPRWLVTCISIATWMKEATGLPIDFQFQPQTFANKHHSKKRHAVGLRLAYQKE